MAGLDGIEVAGFFSWMNGMEVFFSWMNGMEVFFSWMAGRAVDTQTNFSTERALHVSIHEYAL